MRVPILMGSKADLDHARTIADALEALGLEPALYVGSAHKTPRELLDLLETLESRDEPTVYITVAGRSNALSGMVDAQVTGPVIACPPPSERFGGADLFSSLRMPSGVAPAVVLEPRSAALLAAKILGLHAPEIRARVAATQKAAADKVKAANAQIQKAHADA